MFPMALNWLLDEVASPFQIKLLRLSKEDKIQTHLTRREKLKLYHLARTIEGKVIVEIGSYLGASASFLAAAISRSSKDGRLYCVDTWQNHGMTEGGRDTLAEFLENTASYREWLTPLRGSSSEVADSFEHKVDFLFVDGDHSYEGVLEDVKAWLPKLNEGALVAFHDIGWAEGVNRVIAEKIKPHIGSEGSLPNLYWGWLRSQVY